jgi:hypothetical protein
MVHAKSNDASGPQAMYISCFFIDTLVAVALHNPAPMINRGFIQMSKYRVLNLNGDFLLPKLPRYTSAFLPVSKTMGIACPNS